MDLKGREKPWNTQLPVWKKEGGGGIFSTTGSGRSETSAIFYTKCTGGGVLSCSESSPVLQGNHHILFTIVCGWRKKKKKKRREQWRERKPASLCRKRERELVFIWVCQRKQDFFSLHTNSWEHLLFYTAVVSYEWASRAGKQRHPGFSWWWELTSDWFPWILMWRIVCFIEEQKEARWLPFRIC